MFIGHYAVGFAAKKWAPKVSLGTLVVAAIWLDLIWPLFLMLGLEHFRIIQGITKMVPIDFYDYPLSHSLAMAFAWGILWAAGYLMVEKNDFKGAGVIGALVVSHWVLDWLVHRPDLPLLPAAENSWGQVPKYGLSLWNSPAGTYLVEGGLFVLGLFLYLTSTKAKDKIGKFGPFAMAAVLVALYIANFQMTPPSNPNLIALMGVSQLLFVAWAYWLDDHRKVV